MSPVEQGRRLATLAMIGLTLFLIEWNGFLLVASFQSMPKNDFGRPLLSTRAFLDGKDMYAATEGVVIQYDRDKFLYLWDLNPPHSHLLYLPLAVMPPGWPCSPGGS